MGQYLWLLLSGAVFGVANVIPGVSGGTMAVVMGVYDGLVDAIGNFRKNWRKSVKFLLPFLAGAGVAILLFAKLVRVLLEAYPTQVLFFFCGLIIGCLPAVAKRAAESGIKPGTVIAGLVTLAFMIATMFFQGSETGNVLQSLTVQSGLLLFISGMVAAFAMVIPGVSGSMMLMIMGMYWTVLTAVDELNILLLLPFALGVLAGLLLGTKFIAFCLKRFPSVTYGAIVGLVLGSVVAMFRDVSFSVNAQGLVSLIFLLLGAAIAILMGRSGAKAASAEERSR